MWKNWYQFLAKSYKSTDWTFINYGYAPIDCQNVKIQLEKKDEENRFYIQLYHHIACTVNLNNKSLLEVGCGRGGGADYIMRYLNPKTVIGVDFSENSIALCNEYYNLDGLTFLTANAEFLPFPDDSFDVVINIESSHCFISMDNFLYEVKRLLRNGGNFLFADLRTKNNIKDLRKSLNNSGLTLIHEMDITPNIVKSLKLDNEHKTNLIKKMVHKPLIKSFLEFAGTEGSKTYEKFLNREIIYQSFVFQKSHR
jgi:ubiquinone/menaquinone biosynthesis C-methylase UbiE